MDREHVEPTGGSSSSQEMSPRQGLTLFGWTEARAREFAPWAGQGLVPGRVVKQARDLAVVVTDTGDVQAEVSGRFRRAVADASGFPAVGDWVAVRRAPDGRSIIEAVLPRHGVFARRAAGGAADAQVVASNVDVVFLITGLDGDFSVRRIERYVTTAWASGAEPVIVLNKADVAEDPAAAVAAASASAPGVRVVTTSALDGAGVESLLPHLAPGRTVAVLGSSGVGKSTLVNTLLGDGRLATGAVGASSKGRHTTTARELVRLPGGALLIDTPGLRELGLWADADDLDRTFDDVDALAPACRFPNCRHEREPGCAVRVAVDEGRLDPERLDSYLKLRRELEDLEVRRDEKARRRQEKAAGRDFAARRHEVRRNKPGRA